MIDWFDADSIPTGPEAEARAKAAPGWADALANLLLVGVPVAGILLLLVVAVNRLGGGF